MKKHEFKTYVVLGDARNVQGGSEPFYKRRDYEDAALDIAKTEAREGEDRATAFARLLDEKDERVDLLFKAAETSDYFESTKKRRQVRKADRMGKREKTLNLLKESARIYKRANETQEQAMARLLNEDPAFQAAYESYVEAQ